MDRDKRTCRAPARILALLAACVFLAVTATSASALTLSPLNGTPDASPETQISFLGAPASAIKEVSVYGSRSGSHSGQLRSYASETGASFLPSRGFTQGERVTASARVGSSRVSTSFTVAQLVSYSLPASRAPLPAKAGANQSFVSQPKLQPPTVQVTTASSAALPGDVFLTTNSGRGQNGAMIIDAAGRLVWFQPAGAGNSVTDLQVSRYANKPVLTYWEGHIDLGVGFGTDKILGADYRPLASVRAGNGYYADLHELQIAPTGSAYLTAYTLVRADLSSVGGSRSGALQDAVAQEVDIKTGLVMFEWHAYGHVALYDSYANSPRDANRPWDFFHMNSISPAYEIDHHSGSVMWRLGGKRSSFKMGAGTGTAYQHDVRWQPDHTLTLFDNGAVPRAHSESRALHEQIDWAHKTVKLVSRYVRTPLLLSGSQGNSEALANGDSFVGWGEEPYFTEFNAAGQTVFDAHIPAPAQIYRSFRFAWSATPASPPAIALKVTGPATTTIYASWNGATGISAWRIIGGANPAALAAIATVASAGFETATAVPSAAPVFAVQALGAGGEVLATSRVLAR